MRLIPEERGVRSLLPFGIFQRLLWFVRKEVNDSSFTKVRLPVIR